MKSEWAVVFMLAGVSGLAFGQATPPRAEQIFAQRCAACHGEDALGTDRGPALSRSRRLRTRSATEIHDIVRNGTPGGMPAFSLPEPELQSLAAWVRSMNASAIDTAPQGNLAEGEKFFFGKGQCGGCHTAMGRGRSIGPDLTSIGRQATLADMERKLRNPNAQVSDSYVTVTVKLRDGRAVRGLARKETL